MKNILIALMSLMPLLANAQSYSKMWAQVEDFQKKDQPKSALESLSRIEKKALSEKNDAQLLRCVLTERLLKYDIAPDSGRAVVQRMEQALEAETRPVARAMWQSALGQVLLNTGRRTWHQPADTAALERGRELVRQSVGDVATLGRAKAADYLPLFVEGKDSRYFGDDLLSVLARPVLDDRDNFADDIDPLYDSMIAFYESAGRREAALLLKLERIERQSGLKGKEKLEKYEALATEYKSLPLNVETYIAMTALDGSEPAWADLVLVEKAREGVKLYEKEKRAGELRNFIRQKEQPRLTLRLTDCGQLVYPGDNLNIALDGRNVRSARLDVFRFDGSLIDVDKQDDKDWMSKAVSGKQAVCSRERTFSWSDPCETFKDSLAIAISEPGIYICRLSGPDKLQDFDVLYVSRYRPMEFSVAGDVVRITAVDAKTGKPALNSRLDYYTREYKPRGSEFHKKGSLTSDARGDLLLQRSDERGRSYVCHLTVGSDAYCPLFGAGLYRNSSYRQRATRNLSLYTDRAIYRPGQQVQFGGFAHAQNGDVVEAIGGEEVKVRLRDANGKELSALTLTTDDYGSFGGTFDLPTVCLPGTFSLQVSGASMSDMATFKVEEYKRPTFTADLKTPDVAYALGDSIRLEGTATTFTGLPLANAKVRYSVRRAFFYEPDESDVQSGETTTDAEGRFSVPVSLDAGDLAADSPRWWRFYRFRVTADITAESGETADAVCMVYASKRSSWMEIDWPASVCKEYLPKVCFYRRNAPGKNIPTDGHYDIVEGERVVASGTFRTGEAFVPAAFSELPSGQYRVVYRCADLPADTLKFLLFSEKDTRPVGDDVLAYYVRRSEQGDSAYVMVGSPREDITLFYDVVCNGKIIETDRRAFSNELLHFHLAYKPEYGDGATFHFAFMHDSKIYAKVVEIVKPRPDKRLQLRWTTFRDLLRPGQDEEWRLQVVRPDGTPADASIIATLYDASLDELYKNAWPFSLSFGRHLTRANWSTVSVGNLVLSNAKAIDWEDVDALAFTEWNGDYLRNIEMTYGGFVGGGLRRGGRVMLAKAAAPMAVADADMAANEMVVAESKAMVMDEAESSDETATFEAETPAAEPRSNFAETAYFVPTLRTDANGEASIVFRLPESLTTWNFRALAHDKAVNYGAIEASAVARKDFMLQSALPRFLREGDDAVLPAVLTNLSDKPVSGRAVCTLTDAETGEVVATMEQNFSVGTEPQTLFFRYKADGAHPVLTCRMMAEGAAFSDGEERLLPVLANREQVLRTVPFSLVGAGSKTLQIDSLFENTDRATDKRLIVEASSNPTWYALTALPIIIERESHSATQWATRYYSLILADFIAKSDPEIRKAVESGEDRSAWTELLRRNPDLKQTLLEESPWETDADDETVRKEKIAEMFDETATSAKIQTAFSKLAELQNGDGSWSWFKGFNGSLWITVDVALKLIRQQSLTGNTDAKGMLARAMNYMEHKVAEDVREMKRLEKKYNFTFTGCRLHLNYLYIRALMGLEANADAKYLLQKFVEPRKNSMYEKALVALVLAQYGKTDEAQRDVQSLIEHTVSREGMGRYFDTDRALWCWESYKIPTQVAAIEALRLVRPDDLQTLREMRLWLMQSKRTQGWTYLPSATDAIYALLIPDRAADDSVKVLSAKEPLYYTLRSADGDVVGLNRRDEAEAPLTVGYFRKDFTSADALAAKSITVRQREDGLAWGAVYAQFVVPTEDVLPTGNGLAISRKLEVLRGGRWQSADGLRLQKGERLRQVFTVQADRDYDYISIRAARAACMEPVESLSGYTFRDGQAYYRVVRDASNEYFFERFRKGTHVFTEECFLDRSGTYRLGTSKVQCQFSPEFCATTAGAVVSVE